ncbi:cell division protein FtsQ/DivIB [Endozoicomonas sp. SCSIO W0465]|uniref:cell division protein FtsQ/DivIB n=1 Tax=Endozoicomonas sp. SCSIO W0465 TaxID=2918516 RepID=UPI002075BB83|nr:FtsQ-type POTRA domain-containing protein [Endozoicomonas sp. SCSIO W0465]USE34873.1 FtsQ-type POTRA domain-containing protein [Endozoicomonas sp. SCSIO W0465]
MRGASRWDVRQGAGRRKKTLSWKKTLPWKRVLQVLVSLSLLTGLVVSTPWLMSWLNQPIARVEVHAGFEYLSREQVEKLLHTHLQERFFALDLSRIQQVLMEMPWVKGASVRRHWPDSIQVSLEEQQPVARWGSNYLISNEGEVFAPDDITAFAAMPVLDGPDEMAVEVMQQYLAISQLLRPMGLKLTKLKRSNSGSWRFTVGHVEVNIGRDRGNGKATAFCPALSCQAGVSLESGKARGFALFERCFGCLG